MQGNFEIEYIGITFHVQFYFALGDMGEPTFNVAPLSGEGIKMDPQSPEISGDCMTCSLIANPCSPGK